jgi:hypothetical protein
VDERDGLAMQLVGLMWVQVQVQVQVQQVQVQVQVQVWALAWVLLGWCGPVRVCGLRDGQSGLSQIPEQSRAEQSRD